MLETIVNLDKFEAGRVFPISIPGTQMTQFFLVGKGLVLEG